MTDKDGLDPKLQQLYRQLPTEQPSAELDAKIIMSAQLAVRPKTTWQQPFALAATLTITASLIWYWQAEQPLQLERAVSVAKESIPHAPMPTQPTVVAALPSDAEVLQLSRQDSAAIVHNEIKVKQQVNKRYKELDHSSMATMADNTVVMEAKSDEDVKTNAIAAQKQAQAAPSFANSVPASVVAESLLEPVNKPMTTAKPSAMAYRMEAQERSAGAISPHPQFALTKKAKAERQVFSATVEGVSIGMSQSQLLALGFDCQKDVCQKTVTHPSQSNYWGVSATNAQLTVIISQHKVSQMVLTQQQASFDEIAQQIAQFGDPTERDCGLQEGAVKAKSLSVVDGYLLQVRQLDQQVTVTICSAQ